MIKTEDAIWDALDPMTKLGGLIDVANQAREQLAEAIRILKSRDLQIDIALDALVKVLQGPRGCTRGDSWLDHCDHCIAINAIERMRAIHKESLAEK